MVRYLLKGVVAILSVGAFLQGLYLALQDKTAAASICLVAAILPVIFLQLPFVEYLKVLGLEAKLRERVNEADAIVGKLKRIASVSAQQLFTEAALAGRWGGESLSSKQDRAAQLTALLEDLDVSSSDITVAKKIYLRAIARDLAYIFFGVVRSLLNAKKHALALERDALFGKKPIDMRDPKGARWTQLLAEEQQIGRQAQWPENVFGSENVEDMRAFCLNFVKGVDILTDDEKAKLLAIVDEVTALFDACREAGNYTPDTIQYLEKYQPSGSYVNNQHLRFAEAFSEITKKDT
jgi:hypothetical protein